MSDMHSITRLPRLYVAPQTLPEAVEPGTPCLMQADQARYLGTVLRRGAGEQVRLFNALAGEWLASIAEIRKDKGSFRLEQRLRAPAPLPPLTLAFALLKRDATDLVVRMGTELGVTHFLPLITERTNTHRINPDRLTSIAMEAAEQCERLDIPTVAPPQPLASLLGAWPAGQTLFAAIERLEDAPLTPTLLDARAGDGLLIGPEGGLSETECRSLRLRPFVAPVTLGTLVLRADTAVAAGLALMAGGLRSRPVSAQ